ncbi:MAG: dihydroorotase [bacterium]
MSAFTLKGGRVIDPSQGIDEQRDLFIVDGKISNRPPFSGSEIPKIIDVRGKVVCPGLIDMHVHLREPGQSSKETIRSGSQAAAAGGFTSIVAMPNTSPPADAPNTIAWITQRAKETAVVNVFPTGCISQGMKGELLAPIGSLVKEGVVAVTDDGHCIQSNGLMRRALEYCKMFDIPVLDHCQDYSLSAEGVMHEGFWSMVLGLRGWPSVAEEVIVARNALLAELTGARVHCQHLTAAGSVRILREAKRRGVPISGEVCPHHIALTDDALEGYNTNCKVNPPLRSQQDVDALLEGIVDGTIEYLASDHAPHCSYEKEVEFDYAPCGMVGLETELGLFLTHLVHEQIISLPDLISKLTHAPAQFLKLNRGTLQAGSIADVTVIDPDLEWTVDSSEFHSLGRNTPFNGAKLKGRAVMTLVKGEVVWNLEEGFLHAG